MSLSADPYGLGQPPFRREAALWGSAALIVLAAHVGGGWYLSRTLEIADEPAAAQEAMMVDLSPVMESTPEAVEVETESEEEPTEMAAAEEPVEAEQPEDATEVQPEQATPVTEETPPEEMVAEEVTPVQPDEIEPEVAEPEPETLEPEPVEPELAEPEPQVVTEEAIEEPTVALPDSDVPMPVARPEPPRQIVQEERPRPRREQPRPERPRREEPRRETPRPTREARPQPRSQASTEQRASSAPRVSPARWNSQAARRVQNAAQRAIQRVPGTGTVGITFSVSASGGVSGVRVSRSSGIPALDSAVVRAVSGISLPPPPSGATSVSIPVYKNR